jgi:uridine kinase
MKDPNKLVVKRIHEEIQKISKEKKGRIIVTLDGTSGVGKTSISARLKQKIKDNITVINGDSLLVSYRARYSRLNKNKNDPEEFYRNCWFNKKIKRNLRRVLQNNQNFYRYKLRRKKKERIFELELNKKIILIEGCFVSHKDNFGDLADIKILINMNKDDILKRRIERKETRKYTRNNGKFIEMFDKCFEHYMKKYNVIKKSDLRIFAFYK